MPAILMNRAAVERALANAGPMTEQQRRAMFARQRQKGGPSVAASRSQSAPVVPGSSTPGRVSVPMAPVQPSGRVSIAVKYGAGPFTITESGGITRITLPQKKTATPGSRGPAVGSPEWWKQRPEVPGNPGWYVPGGGGGPGLGGGVRLRPAARR
ncbi:MAG: hypothetical protein KBC05_00360 [Candidatus Hydrogenedentes bacterium]|nr:hypothetical protein [Candidatus Hydrogenedentota bacterium]